MTDPSATHPEPVDPRRARAADEVQPPAILTRALEAIASPPALVPPEVERAILGRVDEHFAREFWQRRGIEVAAASDRPATRVQRVGLRRAHAAAAIVLLVASIAATFMANPAPRDAIANELARAIQLDRNSAGGSSAMLNAMLAAMVAVPLDRSLPPLEDGGRFARYDLELDGDTAGLGGWFVELRSSAVIVGIEGGDPPCDEPAMHDASALARGVVRLAQLPDGMTPGGALRVATIALREPPNAPSPEPLSVVALDHHGLPRSVAARFIPRSAP